MAFKIEYEYGDGELGDYEISEGTVQDFNSYANVTEIASNTVTINLETIIEGRFEKFHAGTDIMLQVASTNRVTADYLGKYIFARITLANNGVLTLDKNVEEFFAGVNLDYEYVQAISVPNFDCLKLKQGAVITCLPYNPFHHVGGVLIIRCWRDLVFTGGVVDLRDCGIPFNRKNSLRPLLTNETAANGESDKAKYSGHENYQTAERFTLNAGDGAAFIIAKNLICDETTRIGNPAIHGAAYCRGHNTSVGVKPSNVTNIGGSTILIAADSISNFSPKIIAKYRSASEPEGKGLARCYIASNTPLQTDEGLYAKDILSNPNRVKELGIENFGNGSFGDYVNPTLPLNNYAKITSVSQQGYRLTLTDKTLNGLAPLRVNSLVIALATQKTDKYTKDAGKCVVGRIIGVSGDSVTLNKPAPVVDLNKYTLQLITVPEFQNLTISNNFSYTRKFEKGIGGVCAFAVSGTCDISSGKINVLEKGGASAYGKKGLEYIGNAQDYNRLPIGAGAGSVFILAKNLVMNENTRIGSTFSGLGEGGKFGGSNADGTNSGGGYSGDKDENGTGSGGGFIGGGGAKGLGGSGFAGGTSTLGEFEMSKVVGGYGGSNGKGETAGKAGAHILLIADKIAGFTQAAISTGGSGAKGAQNGAASYGGGGNESSSGGSGGFAFIYTNDTE